MGSFRVKSYGSDHKLARVSFYGARGVVGRGKGNLERYGSIRSLCFSSISLFRTVRERRIDLSNARKGENTDVMMVWEQILGLA